MSRLLGRIIIALMLVIGWSGSAAADWKLDIGYTALQNELGSALPTGASVKVAQVEALVSGSYLPGAAADLPGKPSPPPSTPTMSPVTPLPWPPSFMATAVPLPPGLPISTVMRPEIGWDGAFLTGNSNMPLISGDRVANHSYVTYFSANSMVQTLTRLDWVVARDEYIQVVAMNNGSTNYPILGSSFNAIAVGLSSGNSAHGSYPIATTPTTPYAQAGRTRPDLVAPATDTSSATPMVASAAALLVEVGHNGRATRYPPIRRLRSPRIATATPSTTPKGPKWSRRP